MKTRSAMPSSTFDPFGEPIESVRLETGEPRRRGTRLAAVVMFWALALVLLVGRVYVGDHATAPQAVNQTASTAEEVLTIAQALPLR